MFPHRRRSVLWKKPGRRFAHCFPLDHSETVLFVDFDSGKRFPKGALGPLVLVELVKDGQASTPPGVPTPICRIDVIRAAISPSLSAKDRRETYFRKNSTT